MYKKFLFYFVRDFHLLSIFYITLELKRENDLERNFFQLGLAPRGNLGPICSHVIGHSYNNNRQREGNSFDEGVSRTSSGT